MPLDDPSELACLGDCCLECFCLQFVVVGLAAFAQDQVWSARRLIVCGFEPAVWKADDEIAAPHLDNEVSRHAA